MHYRLARYLIRETFWLYLFGILAFCLLLVIDHLSAWASFLIRQNASLSDVARLMTYQTPGFLHVAFPIALVFAVLLATGRFAKDSELKAAYSLGVSPLSLFVPLLLSALTMSAIAFVNNGFLEPKGREARELLVQSFYSERPPLEAQDDVSYVIEGQGIYYAARIQSQADDDSKADLRGVLVSMNDGRLISSPDGVWDSVARTWWLESVQIIDGTGERQVAEELELSFELDSNVEDSLADPDKQTVFQLFQQLQLAKRTGLDSDELSFNFHRQIADAFSTLIFSIIAGSLGLTIKNRSAGFAWTIVLLVVFYFLWVLSGDLYKSAVLPPIVSAWFTSLVVGGCGLVFAWFRLR